MATLALPTYVSISEAAKRFQLSREALSRLVEAGRVRAVELDGNVAVAEEDVSTTTSLDLPTYISVSEAVEKYDLDHETLTRLVKTGRVRAVKINENIAVAEEDVDTASSLDLPTYISTSEAIERYNLDYETLTSLVKTGKVRAVEVDGSMVVAKEDVGVALIQSVVQLDESLRGQPIRATEAAKQYDVSERTLGRWAESGYIRVIERGPKLLALDEADVKLATEIFQQACEETGSYIKAGWILKRTLEKFHSS